MVELPQEIVDIIVDQVYHSPAVAPSKSPVDTKSTMSCALVCSSWRTPAQRNIFLFAKATRAFVDTYLRPTIDEASKDVLRHVKNIAILAASWGSIPSGDDLADTLTLVLQRCTSMCALHIVAYLPSGGISPDHLVRLRRASSSPELLLRTLRFGDYADQSTLFGQLMSSLPSLEFVQTSVQRLQPNPGECKARLSELRLTYIPDPEALRFILQSSHSSLRTLDLKSSIDIPLEAIDALKPCLRNLRSLRLDSYASTGLPVLSLVTLCPNLRELAFVDTDGDTFSPLVDNDTMPAPLEHWWVHFQGPITSKRLEPYVTVIKEKPTLRQFTFSGRYSFASIEYPTLKKACRERGISLVLSKLNWMYPDVFPSKPLSTRIQGERALL